jgi:hypothetical protein
MIQPATVSYGGIISESRQSFPIHIGPDEVHTMFRDVPPAAQTLIREMQEDDESLFNCTFYKLLVDPYSFEIVHDGPIWLGRSSEWHRVANDNLLQNVTHAYYEADPPFPSNELWVVSHQTDQTIEITRIRFRCTDDAAPGCV